MITIATVKQAIKKVGTKAEIGEDVEAAPYHRNISVIRFG